MTPRSLPPKGGVTPVCLRAKGSMLSCDVTMSSQDRLCSSSFDTYRNCIKAAAAFHSLKLETDESEAATEPSDTTQERERNGQRPGSR